MHTSMIPAQLTEISVKLARVFYAKQLSWDLEGKVIAIYKDLLMLREAVERDEAHDIYNREQEEQSTDPSKVC
jgi:hypothetical protein